jgi:DMSO/TMAO reductase YedYZ molybdopterin-dependent catalytic subunit
MLPRQYGAPLRLRSELQIGYKNSKHIEKISLVESLAGIGKGKGGLWEDFGLQWYAGM